MKITKLIMRKAAVICAALLLILGVSSVSGIAHAADIPAYRIGITPTQQALGTIEPGEEYSGTFKVRNSGQNHVGFKISFSPYTITNENYEPSFTEETKYTAISRWITTDIEEGELDSGQETEVHYTVSIPENAAGGAQAATIIVTMVDNLSSSGNAIETVQQVGYLIFGNVNGDVIETGKIIDHKVPSFLFQPPIFSSSMVENTGNVYTNATYKLQVFPLFSDEEIYTNEETPENSIVFPETKRYHEAKWEGSPQLGIFKVRSTVKIFDEESVVEKLVFLCPIWFLFIVILLIFLIIFWIVSRIIKRRKEA